MMKNKQKLGMVDIGHKPQTRRRAIAVGTISFSKKAFDMLIKQGSPKGDVFETAKIAGIMAAKSTPQLIPLCHPLALEKVLISFEQLKSQKSIRVTCEVLCYGKTGVEMESLAAVSAACLTIYDMCKWMGQDMAIKDIKLLHKSGGQSGDFNR